MSIEAGKLRHRVTIQHPGSIQDQVTGEVVNGWTDVAKVWAAVEPVSGRELIASQASQSQIETRIVIRYRTDMNSKMRVLHRGMIYNIEALLPDKDSGLEYITLMCSGGVNEG